MKPFLKAAAVAAGLAAALSAAAALYLKVNYPPERLRELVLDKASSALHRQMRLSRASLSLLNGLSLENFELSEKPDFSAGRFISAKQATIRPYFFPLLQGRMVIKSLQLKQPNIHLARGPEGRFNFSDLAASSNEAPSPRQAAADPTAYIAVNQASLEEGSVLFEDAVSSAAVSISGLRLSAKSFSLITPFALEASCRFDGHLKGAPVSGQAQFRGRLALGGGGNLRIDDFSLAVLKTSLALTGTLKDFADPEADAVLKIKSFDPQSFELLHEMPPALKQAQMEGELSFQGGRRGFRAKGPLRLKAAGLASDAEVDISVEDPLGARQFKAQANFSRLTMDPKALPAALKVAGPLSLRVAARGSPDDVIFSAVLEGKEAEVSYEDKFHKPAGVEFALRPEGVLKNQEDLELKAFPVKLGAAVFGLRGHASGLKGEGKLNFTLEAPRLPLEAVSSHVPMARGYALSGQGDLTAKISGKLDAPLIRGSLALKNSAASPMAGVRAEGLQGSLVFSQKSASGAVFDTSGTCRAASISHAHYYGKDFRLSWDLKDLEAGLARLGGNAEFSAGAGKIMNLPLAAKINRLLRKDASEIPYDSMQGRFKAVRGLLNTQDFTVKGPDAEILCKGTVRLSDLESDLRMFLALPAGSVGGSLGSWFSDSAGRPSLEAALTGTLSDPAVKVDVSRAVKKAGESLLEKYLKKQGDESPRVSSGAAQGAAPENTRDVLIQETFDRLFRKKKPAP